MSMAAPLPGMAEPREKKAAAAPKPKAAKSRASAAAEAPIAPAGTKQLLAMAACALAFAGLGMWHVHTVFAIRDNRMETRVMQVETARLRDQAAELRARLGRMRSNDSMRAAALAWYGMADPDPATVERIVVTDAAKARWADAAAETEATESRRAQAAVSGRIASQEFPTKEVPSSTPSR